MNTKYRPGTAARASHWDRLYALRSPEEQGWYELEPMRSLTLIDALGVPAGAPVLDVGGAASTLADALVAHGFQDICVLDVSERALALARTRLEGAPGVRFLHADVLAYEPERPLGCWHDRAVLHFLVDPADRDRYLELLRASVAPGGGVILATAAPESAARRSGLPVRRYSPEELAALVGEGFSPVRYERERRVTPLGAIEWFSWVALERAR